MKLRALGALLAACFAIATVGAAQTKPSFTGTWKFVPEKSTPADGPALGDEFRISHESNSLVLELPTKESQRTSDGKVVTLADGRGEPIAFKIDGDDHVVPPSNPVQSTGDRTTFNTFLVAGGGKYRVSWKGSSLVINSADQIPTTTFANGASRFEVPRRLVSTTFTMNPDGTLTVERVSERDPKDGGQGAINKTVFKSVYRRAN